MVRAFRCAQCTTALDELVASGALGETIFTSFWLVADQNLEEVRLSAAHISGAATPSATDVWVVKRWKQAGIGVYRTQSVEVDELLMKDDRGDVPLGRYGFRLTKISSLLRRRRFYRPPRVRLTGAVATSFRGGQRKQFVLEIRVPADGRAGRYWGEVTIKWKKLKQTLPIVLEIWPIRLAEPRQDLVIWYKGTTREWQPQHFVSSRTLSSQLRDIAALGFRGVSLVDAEPRRLSQVLRRALRAGLRGPFIMMPPYDERTHRIFSAHATDALYCVSDEPDAHGDAEIKRHVENTRKVTGWQGRTICSLLSHGSRALVRASAEDVAREAGWVADIESLYLPLNTQYLRMLSRFPELKQGKIYYYWMCHMEKPQLNRVLAGVYLWKSKADGIVPYCYQHLPRRPASPFDDFSDWEPGFHIGEERRPLRHHMTTYPARQGSVWTLQWLGLRDGITDLRYLSTLDGVLAEARRSDAQGCLTLADEIERDLKRFTDRIDLGAIEINSETHLEPYPAIAPSEYQDFRFDVAKNIMKLQRTLSDAASNAESPSRA